MDKDAEAKVRRHIAKWTGTKVDYAWLLHDLYPEKSYGRWRNIILAFSKKYPDDTPKEDSLYDIIPGEWSGSWADLARRLHKQRPDLTVNAWRKRIEVARERGAITHIQTNNFTIQHLVDTSDTVENLWERVESESKKAILGKETSRWADISFNETDKFIGIAFASDQHIGNKFTDHERMREDAELIARTENCYVIHAGDFIDNFVIDKPKPAMKAPIPPSTQWKLLDHYLSLFEDKMVGVVAGNHDLWNKGMTDYDPLEQKVKALGVLYHEHELNMRLWVGSVPYHISVRHKRRGNSQLNPGRVIKKWYEDGDSEFDIGVIGHNHVPVVESFTKHGLERWAIRPGSYKVMDKFAEMIGFGTEKPSCPMAILNPHTREIQVFSDLRLGVRTLEVLNGD